MYLKNLTVNRPGELHERSSVILFDTLRECIKHIKDRPQTNAPGSPALAWAGALMHAAMADATNHPNVVLIANKAAAIMGSESELRGVAEHMRLGDVLDPGGTEAERWIAHAQATLDQLVATDSTSPSAGL